MKKAWKFVVVVEDTGMDSGCIYAILKECNYHGKVLEVYTQSEDGHKNDLMATQNTFIPGPILGRC